MKQSYRILASLSSSKCGLRRKNKEGKNRMAYTILRFKKDKGGAIAGCERHNERKKEAYKSNPDIDMNKSKENYHIIHAPQYTYSRKIKELIKEYGCKTRKDSVKLVETLITASPEFMNRLSKGEQREYFERAVKFMKDEIGEDRIISAVVHMDEATPHMHLVFCPINKDGKLSAKSILGNQKSLSEWQTRYYNYMHERWNELERGKSAQETKRKHIPTWLFKLADNLDNLYNQLLKKIENINMIGMKKNKEEAINILSEFVPKAEKFSAKVNSYNDYINELEERVLIQRKDNRILAEENLDLKEKIDRLIEERDGKSHFLEVLNSIPLKIKYADLVGTSFTPRSSARCNGIVQATVKGQVRDFISDWPADNFVRWAITSNTKC